MATTARLLLSAMFLLTLVPGHAQAPEPDYTEQEQANMKTILKILEVWSGVESPDRLMELVHEDFTNHFAPPGRRDRASFIEAVKGVRGAMQSFEAKSVTIFARGDWVAMRDESRGQHANGTFSGDDIHIFRMKDGKMYEHWNSFGLDNQLQKLNRLIAGEK